MRKLNWYYRQKVGFQDMRELQDNLEEAIHNTLLDLFATGFIAGGEVQPNSPANMTVRVTAGRGYDENGNRIFIPTVQTVDLSSHRPGTSGRERWVLIAARFRRVESEQRTDGHGNTLLYRSDPSFEIVARPGSDASIGAAQKPAKQPGDVIRGYVRVYNGQTAITASDISTAEAEQFLRARAHEVGYGSETVESALNARLPSAGQKDALAGTAGTPSSSNRYVTNSDPRLPTQAQKDALAGTNGTPSSSNRYVTNSDPRLTNARTPTAHASTHKTGGSDPLTPADIGAAPANHTHSELPTSGQKAALAGTHGTPSNTNRYVTNSDPRLSDARPPAAHASTHKAGGSDPLTPADIGAAPANHSHSWDQITNKPTSFPPSSHTHSWSQITGAPDTATRWPTWNEVSGKPGSFPPSSHHHDDRYPRRMAGASRIWVQSGTPTGASVGDVWIKI